MKLLFCPHCQDVFKLDYEPRACRCGKVTGHYTDQRYAVTNGEGVSLAIGNGSLHKAIVQVHQLDSDRAFYPVMCWVRPNEGPANPHTKVVKEKR